MPALDYAGLTKVQKLAAFLIVVGSEQASELLKQIPDSELEEVVREMAAMEVIDFELQEKVVQEFCELVGHGLMTALGGASYARQALEQARGEREASNILLKALPASNSIDAVRELDELDPRQIFSLIKEETPQTVCFLFSYMDPRKVAQILPLFAVQKREEIVERLGLMEPISGDLIGTVLKSVNRRMATTPQRRSVHHRGGVNAVAQLLNALDRDLSKTLLSRIEERNAALGEAIRKNLFSLEDLMLMSTTDLQRVLREADGRALALIMKSASEGVRNAIYGAMSRRAAQALREEVELLGPVRYRDVEAAQDTIIALISSLSENGEIQINRRSDEVIS